MKTKKRSFKQFFGGFPGARYINKEESDAVLKVVKAKSPYRFYGMKLQLRVEALEKICCKEFGRKYALAISSGTSALHTALFSLGVSSGDEVILPAYAWSADLMAIIALNAVPVIAPIDQTLGLDPLVLEKCFSSKTKAIIAVHMRGYLCNIKGIKKKAAVRNIPVIEDGSQCIGGRIAGYSVGHLGDISVLSFQYNKLITCGEGGILLTNNKVLYERAYRFHDLGMLRRAGEPDPEGKNIINSLGLNYRLSELQAAILIPQIKKIPRILNGLKNSYRTGLAYLSSIRKKYKLQERKLFLGMEKNHAFLCLTADSSNEADMACKDMLSLGIPVQKASRLDPHHFKTWEAFLKRERIGYRLLADMESENILDRSFFIEINSDYE